MRRAIPASVPAFGPARDLTVSRGLVLSAVLLVGCAAVAVAAFAVGKPAATQLADPGLARLLRGMAIIKGSLVVAGLTVLGWRFRWPIGLALAAGYTVGAWVLVAASVLIWQLSVIALAALAFHVAAFALLVLAWRDTRDHRAHRSR